MIFGDRKYLFLAAFCMLCSAVMWAQNEALPSIRFKNNTLIYYGDSLGNHIPDYSFCGYRLSEKSIPQVPAKVVISITEADATEIIQNAIDYVAKLPLQENGFRGAILLKEGTYNIGGRLKITTSGIVLRGSGKNSILKATGKDRQTLIRIFGENDIQALKQVDILDGYVPVNATKFQISDTREFKKGDPVFIHRPSTKKWITKMGMVDYGGETGWLGWKPGQRDMYWEREIEKVEGNTITLNIPITASIDTAFGGGKVLKYKWPSRISNVGIENFTLVSEYNEGNPKDENHCWFGITMENVSNAWVRQMNFQHFSGSAVALYETASKVTVVDCISTHPVSEIAGQRRNTFFTMGQQTLFLRCYAENGNHDFATGFCAAGPNAFVQCESHNANSFSGAIDSWASGALFDIVTADGQALSFKNRGQNGQGAGWTAANSMFWQCSAGRIECYRPPLAQNYAYGAWSQFAGDGLWYEENSHINPRSLFFAQLAQRLDKNYMEYADEVLPFGGESTSSPSIEQAAKFTKESVKSPIQLKAYITSTSKRNPISLDEKEAIRANEIPPKADPKHEEIAPIMLANGWLSYSGKVLTGFQHNVPWWRGTPRPYSAQKASPSITRFVPGRNGNGYTDNLDEVVNFMESNHIGAIYHNYGLWYDRRRDDHERVKRYDSESWAPFYEQPFERSGQGEAWDKLSKYDLTKYNAWYWNRLNEFAEKAERKGKLLIHQNYFQHNILEAGAHWTDSPWRPANNINDTGFPEPPPYSGDKRIYLADQFYDIANPARKDLHRAYIRQCLNNFIGKSNVIQSISAEYTGPLHFVEFWLDVIAEWEKETGNDALVALSTTKDVQDAILADKKRSKLIDIIDIRYWAYRSGGSVYAPPGGVSLAPRQHARKVKPGKRNFESVYRSVSEYRVKYPQKGVMYAEGHYTGFGWAILMAGGSVPAMNVNLPDDFCAALAEMVPVKQTVNGQGFWKLEKKGKGLIIYSKTAKSLSVDLNGFKGDLIVRFLNPGKGVWYDMDRIIFGGEVTTLEKPVSGDVVVWISKK